MKYLVIEIQTFEGGSISTPTYAYDDRLAAESKYHTILASAVTSKLPLHACTMMASDGREIMHQSYTHTVEAESTLEETTE